jgi:hypothetical protein
MSDLTPKKKRPYRRRQPVSPSVGEIEQHPSASAEPIPVASESVPSALRLTQNELFQLRLSEMEVRAATAEKEASRLRRMYYLSTIDPKGTILAEEKRMAEKDAALQAAKAKFSSLRTRIGTRLSVDMNKAGIDVETGEVMVPSA